MRLKDAQWNEYYYHDPRDNKHIVALSKLDRQISGRIVSLAGTTDKEGMIQTWSAFSEPGNMDYYFDMGWVKLFYRYGVIPGGIYLLALIALLYRLYRHKDAGGLAVFMILAVYTVMEAHVISVYLGRNVLLLMMGYYFFETVPELPGETGFRGER